ncbi:protein-S-isoprenylcysteine O-methyltransferase isoform X2 [Diabrotica virgifera virgifera]|uniref:Protein-S-isoprenylcysteine O-methyltransferase n=1 Tax=Diabrotica virgifera virgifera TaxID=50390 RepID=A0A6P7H3J4_DIAVI|nr:protein-S-isoprenylcysteine O-methyltransferase isoform X2 [Diabrotica virgifera virgifera]
MVCIQVQIGLKSFFLSFALVAIVAFVQIYYSIIHFWINVLMFSAAGVIDFVLVKVFFRRYFPFQIAVRAAFLGYVFALGIFVKLVVPSHIQIFGSYICVMSFFHFSEFIAIGLVQPKFVSTDSFVLNHSPQYIAAAVSSWVEFFVEYYFFPAISGMKQFYWVSNIGLGICVLGELLRKTAMLTAGSNFNHLVQCEKFSNHTLVTYGVYGWFRHPSYVGWFYWSIGTQILLLNPLCVPAYALASWLFFKTRIEIEEITLLNFFGQNYCDYQEKVWTGIPFIYGYRI